eukprot:TRINITY_DN3282_c0_g3_i1.p1 TRINITY_DN3282_c0_g3~~TRINITY_DN3282_c0_g3_i1.p1  ORF type:complete len:369 (+),score=70.88 TRINITY_DN3282_c0_g3_i1:130-1236(+)
MEKELLEMFEAAKKAADAATSEGSSSDHSESRCVDALKQLRNTPVTMQDLVSTQVGKRLRYLTKHSREKIRTVASDLLEVWKNVVIEETAKNNKKNGNLERRPSNSERTETVKVEKLPKVETFSKSEAVKVEKIIRGETIKTEMVSRTETVKAEKVSKGESVKVEKIHKEEKPAAGIKKSPSAPVGTPKLTSMIKCNDSVRDKLRELLADAFSKVSSEADEDFMDDVNACDPIRVAVLVESVMFEKLGRSNGAQKFKYRSIMFNLKDANNPDLRRKVLLGQIKPEKLISLSPEEMASDQRKRENNQIKEKALFDCERAGAPKATTDQFKCGRCGQRKTTYYQLQTRSADEPMTTFVTCVNCNNHWKFC